jgi:hypothetical protein
MADLKIRIAKVREVENIHSRYIDDNKHKNDRPFDGLRIRAEFEGEDFNTSNEDIPWAFPLLPKTFQSIPKIGEAVIILYYHGNEPHHERLLGYRIVLFGNYAIKHRQKFLPVFNRYKWRFRGKIILVYA